MYRGQGAVEYVVLLAIVLVITLLAIVLLGGMVEGSSAAMDSESRVYWANVAQPFSIIEWNQIQDTLYIKIKNKRNERIILRALVIGNITADLGAGWTVGGGASKNISIAGFQMCNETTYDNYHYNVTIYYDTSSGLTNASQKGTKQLVGRCSFP